MTDGPLPKHDPCEDIRRPTDGTQAWLGMTIAVVCALATALLLAFAAWRWW